MADGPTRSITSTDDLMAESAKHILRRKAEELLRSLIPENDFLLQVDGHGAVGSVREEI